MHHLGIWLKCSHLAKNLKSPALSEMRDDCERWNRKYRGGAGSVTPRAEPELLAHRRLLQASGTAIELACGTGANALYLASLGYDVVAADISIEGLKIANRAAQRLGLKIQPVVMDLDQYPLPKGHFSMISVIRYLNRAMFRHLVEALRPGGLLFYKTFNRRHLEIHPHFNPTYVLHDGELNAAFAALDVISHGEDGPCSYLLGLNPDSD